MDRSEASDDEDPLVVLADMACDLLAGHWHASNDVTAAFSARLGQMPVDEASDFVTRIGKELALATTQRARDRVWAEVFKEKEALEEFGDSDKVHSKSRGR